MDSAAEFAQLQLTSYEELQTMSQLSPITGLEICFL